MGNCNQEAAQEILSIVPHVMRAVAAELRRSDRSIMPGHYHMMAMLADGHFSLSEIAGRQHVSLPTMSRSMSTLEERGWVEKVRDASDGRITRLKLTDEGRAVLAEIHDVVVAAVNRQLAGLTSQECQQLVRGLAVLHQAFEHPDPGTGEDVRVDTRHTRSVTA
jgi:DNA-binding MarR family transcriptional regulator